MNLLAAYDAQLRGDGELHDVDDLTHIGPVTAAVMPRGVGFATYHHLDEVEDVPALIRDVIKPFERHTDVPEFEWKTRGHDRPESLGELLEAAGFEAEPEETVMVGEAHLVAQAPQLPAGVTVRQITSRADVERTLAVQEAVFGRGGDVEVHFRHITDHPDECSMWVAESDGNVIGAGRIVIVPGAEFAGVWGGVVLREFRGQGIYRALVAARAQWAMARGVTLIHSDCSDMSRPILERSGLTAVTTSTPYIWRRN